MTKINDILTIVLPVKNEEKNLPGCLDNIRGFDNVILVDSGSTDKTLEIFEEAKESHPKWLTLQFNWNGKFPKKRNWVLRTHEFSTPWVMFLDADERITPEWIEEAETKLQAVDDKVGAWICYYDNWFMGRMLKHGDVMHKTAILKIGAGEYEKIEENGWSALDMEIHEHLQVKGVIGTIKAHLNSLRTSINSPKRIWLKNREFNTIRQLDATV